MGDAHKVGHENENSARAEASVRHWWDESTMGWNGFELGHDGRDRGSGCGAQRGRAQVSFAGVIPPRRFEGFIERLCLPLDGLT